MELRIRSLAFLSVLFLALPAWAATPVAGVLTPTSGPVTYTAGPFTGANPTPVPLVDAGPQCFNPVQPCDDFALTIDLPASYLAQYPNAAVKVTMTWTDSGAGVSDYDLYIYNGAVPSTDGSQSADYQSASGANPEVATIAPMFAGSRGFTFKLVPYTPTAETVDVTIELLPGSGGVAGDFGGADPAVPGAPRYQNYYAPEGSAAQVGSGEFNIGFNRATKRIMAMNSGPVLRLTPAEIADPEAPESCEAVWEEKSSVVTDVGIDPILFTDEKTGRTFASNSTVGANAVFAYTDNDGDLWAPISISPVNGGTDHQTIGSGPYPASMAILSNPLNQGQAVYFCSQTWPLGPAACQRSDTLGASFGPGVLAYQGNNITQCAGLHGHVRVARDGTVWLPANQCGGRQGGAVSSDAGITWSEFIVSGSLSQINGADPSIALDAANTAYYCYVHNEPVAEGSPPEGHVRVKVSHDRGATWVNDFDLGAVHGIRNAVHPEAIAGSAGRAACAFIGTNVPGDYQSMSFPGVWYPFVATTYDGGRTWTTVNAAPNDPVQRASGIWQQGGSHTNRNLLDFNEITLDDRGRVLFGYSDGCVSPGCVAGTSGNDFVADMRIARQSGGRSLLASFDQPEPRAPARACLAGTRDANGSQLQWKAPDHGGAAIESYRVLRGTSPDQLALVGTVAGSKTQFIDASADPAVETYHYAVQAVSAAGAGAASNAVALLRGETPPEENVCALPGRTLLSDASGDTSAILGVVTTPAGPGMDLLSAQISQPYVENGEIKLAITINTDPGQSPQPPQSAWYVAMKIADPAPATTFRYRAVRMAWNGLAPTFESYIPSASNGGTVDGRFVTAGSIRPADPSSSYAAPFDKVVIVVKASDLGLAPGDAIAGFVSGVAQTVVAASSLYDQMPDSLAFAGSYTVASNQQCRPNTAPLAVLAAAPREGTSPLTVEFVGGGTDADTAEPPDTIVSYTFDFGDGSAPVTQSGNSIVHTYEGAFRYTAYLTVTDSRGKRSENVARQNITVTEPPRLPDLTLAKSHSGDFARGQAAAQYTLSARNAGAGPTTTAQVVVTDTLPAGLTATAISGAGWTCTLVPGPRCTTSGVQPAGHVYPPITLTVKVANNAPASVVNTAAISGGGDSDANNNSAQDPTTIRKK